MTESDRFTRLKEILLRAADLPEDERAAFLDRACSGDSALRDEIETLLAHEADRHEILKSNATACFGPQGQPNEPGSPEYDRRR